MVLGVPPQHDDTNAYIKELNELLQLDSRFGYKFIGMGCFFGTGRVLKYFRDSPDTKDKVHLSQEGLSKLRSFINSKIIG